MKPNLLITGSSGFVGSHVLESLLRDGRFEISVILRNPDGFKAHPGLPAPPICKGDITRPDTLSRALAGKEVIIHCAALMSNFESQGRKAFYEVNVRGTENLLEATDRNVLKQFIHVSTAGVYGACRNGPANEDAPYGNVLSDYEWSKKEAELAVLKYAKRHNIPYTILRPSQMYGAAMRYGWVDTLEAISSGQMVIPGMGEGRIHLVNIRDFVDAVKSVILNEAAANRIYNIAGPEVLCLADVFDSIAGIVNAKRPRRVPYAPVYAASLVLGLLPAGLKRGNLALITPHRVSFFSDDHYYDTTRARAELNFAPRVKIADGMKEMVEWCSREGLI
jgi:nucleoside-diphosphate-sugar epimerase